MATNIFRRAFAPRERYQRPHNYNISVGLTAVCLAPGRQRTPVISFLIQNDINNAGIINVGDPHVSLLNGVQLDPGRAWVFSIFTGALVTGSLFQTPADFAEMMELDQRQAAGRPRDVTPSLYIDIADFYAISDVAAQNLRIFWSTTTT